MEDFTWASSAEIKMTELERTIKGKNAVLINGSSSITGKVRRRRTVYSRSHLDLLLKTFETNPYPGISVREKLSHLTGVHESRIQVWFQNRRARKNKKITQEKENGPHDTERPQFSQIPQAGQVAQPAKKHYGMEYIQKYEDIYKTCALPLQTWSHLHMNSLAGPQPWQVNGPSYTWSNPRQPTSVKAPYCFLNSFDVTQPQLLPHVKPQLFPSSNLSSASISLETHGSGQTAACAIALESGQGAVQEFSLQDILEEFQPSWSEVANNLAGIMDDPLFCF